MRQIPLSQVPAQSISFSADGSFWTINLYTSIRFVCADVIRDGTPIAQGVRCFAGVPLMPYAYMYAPKYGNFVFTADVDWSQFGGSCNLMYMSYSEFVEFQNQMGSEIF